jgi:hypothetical protein
MILDMEQLKRWKNSTDGEVMLALLFYECSRAVVEMGTTGLGSNGHDSRAEQRPRLRLTKAASKTSVQ